MDLAELAAKYAALEQRVNSISTKLDELHGPAYPPGPAATCPLAHNNVTMCMKETAENVRATRENLKHIVD